MPFFRRTHDLHQATTRLASSGDLTVVSRLIRDNTHRFFSPPSSDLPALLESAPAIALEHGHELFGVACTSWPVDHTVWIRALALADGVPVAAGLELLLPPLYQQIRARSAQHLFYAGDLSADAWIQPELLRHNWVRETDVVVYEKTALDIPSHGNQDVRVRRAQMVDLPAVLALDQRSFAAQWVKDEGVLGPAILEQPTFLIADDHGVPAGYAFATSHFNGKLIHLVRIAVDPQYRNHAIGVRLLAEIVAFAQRSGAISITLNTQLENRTAQRLYEWFGFRRNDESQTVLRFDL